MTAQAMTSGDWRDRAACLGEDPALFFPEPAPGESTADMYVEGKRVCARCPVRDECLAFALDMRIDHGLYGGLSPATRTRMAKGPQQYHRICERTDCRKPFTAEFAGASWCSGVCRNWASRVRRRGQLEAAA